MPGNMKQVSPGITTHTLAELPIFGTISTVNCNIGGQELCIGGQMGYCSHANGDRVDDRATARVDDRSEWQRLASWR